jgi:arginine/ornithine N-succinyltransferase beta subunit
MPLRLAIIILISLFYIFSIGTIVNSSPAFGVENTEEVLSTIFDNSSNSIV